MPIMILKQFFPGSSNREVQRYNISGNDPTGAYQLVFDGETTDCIYANASDSFVKMKLDALSIITSVSVSRSQSYEYRITFSGAGMHGNQNQITTTSCAPFTNGKDLTNSQITTIVDGGNTIIFETADGSSVSMSGSTFRNGVPHGSSYLAPVAKVLPSGPRNVKLSIVSTNSLGVSWNAPLENGGDTVTKYLIEWDSNYAVSRAEKSKDWSHVVSALTQNSLNTKLQTAYINTKLER